MDEAVRMQAGRATRPASLAVEACVTLVAALFAFLALDDITTDNATTGFKPEYRLLGLCAVWLLYFVAQLWRKHRRALAMISLVVLGAAAWVAQDGLGHKRAGGWSVFWREYSVTLVAWLWFLALAVHLLRRAFRRSS